jgi:Cytochrome c biogenesis factor
MNMPHGESVDIASGTPGFSQTDQYYCPPGAKFCPAPGANNTVFLDTHFGMDAKTGQVTAYTGTTHPNEVSNPPMTGEQVLFSAPPVSVENRYVPYPGAPQTNMAASTSALSQPLRNPNGSYDQMVKQQPSETSRPVKAVVGPQSYYPTQSEVANKQANRAAREERITQNERVPWWKGGIWRNRGNDKEERDDIPTARRASPAAARQDDVWDDEDEYSGYNPDGSVGRQNTAQSYQASSPAYNDPYGTPQQSQPYNDPYAQPMRQQYADPYPQGASMNNGPMYAGDAYTLPDSPPPTSPYAPGYAYPGAPGYTEAPIPASNQTLSGNTFLPPPPGSASSIPPSSMGAMPSSMPTGDASGSAQFEDAVRMVKDGRFSEAKSILTTETRNNPGNAAGWRWLGDCHYNLLELDDAVNAYQRALDRDPNDYYALRGQGFAHLHRGHEQWRRMQEEVAMGQKDQAAATFAQAHENYKKSLELLGLCLRRAPNDTEAVYGEAMAAEGASRKLYSNAISYLKLGPENRERAELFAENCLTVINKGIDRARERSRQSPGESGPRALLGGLYLRKAILYNQLGKQDLALMELKNSRDVQQSILDDIDKNNATAQKGVQEADAYWDAWGGNR